MLYTNLINKNNTWSNFAGQRKDCFDIFLSFTKPLQQTKPCFSCNWSIQGNTPQKKVTYNINTFEVMLDIEMLMKFAPASVATAFASIVFPLF